MSWRSAQLVKAAVLLTTAALLSASEARAGGSVHSTLYGPKVRNASARDSQSQSGVAGHVPSVVTVVVLATPPLSSPEQFTVALRGSDGQKRRFPVEGGREAIQSHQVILHAGQSLTITWLAAK